MKLYHGSNQIIENPLHNGSRDKTDFGKGFYLTANGGQAERWSIRGENPVVNCYEISLEALSTYEFTIGLEWLLFIIYNRQIGDFNTSYLRDKFMFLNDIDVIIGPTADDRMYNTLEEFFDGDISLEKTLDLLNCMDLSMQYLVKTSKGIGHTKYLRSYEITGHKLTKAIEDSQAFMAGIKTEVKRHQRKQYTQERFIEDIREEIENGFKS